MGRAGLLGLSAAALLALAAGCDQWNKPKPVDSAVAQSCRDEGFDPGTTEYADCVEELSESGQE